MGGTRNDRHSITWLGTTAARYLGITPRTLYMLIDKGELAAYRFGRVIRLQQAQIDHFIDASRIKPGTLGHLYPEVTAPTAQPDDENLQSDTPEALAS